MKILVITGPVFPNVGNNVNLLSKLIPYFLENNEIQILSTAYGAREEDLPQSIFNVPIHWALDNKKTIVHNFYAISARLKKDPGYAGDLGASLIADKAKEVRKDFRYDLVLSTMQPYEGALAASRLDKVKKAVYLMDPPDFVLESLEWDKGQKQLKKVLRSADVIFTTRFIKDAVIEKGLIDLSKKMFAISFPHIEKNYYRANIKDIPMDPGKINLVFCGALFPSVRSPECFLKVLKCLDERFSVIFLGRNCEDFWSKYAVDTKAEVRAYPPQPYQIALNVLLRANVLINIGNNMLVHMPSKTLEYINTGKPIVNFYKFTNCPTLYYTKRYPLCINIFEKEFLPERDIHQFINFCLENNGRQLSREFIESEFNDCRPQTIADEILTQFDLL